MRKLSVLLLGLVSTHAFAQDAPAPLVPQFAEIETVEVQGQPGPALWHVKRGDSEVWILGMVGAMPKNLDWNKQYLSDMLDGARAIIMPPRAKFDILDVGWFVVTHCCSLFRLPGGQKLDNILPDEMRARLSAAREAVGGDDKLYQGDEPLGAAQRLTSDFMKKAAMTGNEPIASINKLAASKHVPQEPASRIEVMPVIKDTLKIGFEQQCVCLGEAIEDVARMSLHADAAARAWAVGDIKGVKANFAESRTNDCLDAAVQSYGAVDQSRVPAFTAAINAALDKPGKTIVVMGMGPLLRKGGVLEQLQALHMTIEGPKE